MSAVEFVCLSQGPSTHVCALLISRETSSWALWPYTACTWGQSGGRKGGKKCRGITSYNKIRGVWFLLLSISSQA